MWPLVLVYPLQETWQVFGWRKGGWAQACQGMLVTEWAEGWWGSVLECDLCVTRSCVSLVASAPYGFCRLLYSVTDQMKPRNKIEGVWTGLADLNHRDLNHRFKSRFKSNDFFLKITDLKHNFRKLKFKWE